MATLDENAQRIDHLHECLRRVYKWIVAAVLLQIVQIMLQTTGVIG